HLDHRASSFPTAAKRPLISLRALLEGSRLAASAACAHHDPALVLRYRSALDDLDAVADLESVLLVVRVILLRTPHRLLEQRVRVAALHLDHDRLVVLVGDDHSVKYALWHLRYSFAARLALPPARLARATVNMRAMSRRTARTREVFSSCPE